MEPSRRRDGLQPQRSFRGALLATSRRALHPPWTALDAIASLPNQPRISRIQTMADITIMDGGMGHLLRRNGVEIKGVIGSLERFLGVALANKEKPGLVRDAHIEYLRAGARVIITNNYCCVPSALELSEKKENASITELIDSAGRCAREAVEMFAKEKMDAQSLFGF